MLQGVNISRDYHADGGRCDYLQYNEARLLWSDSRLRDNCRVPRMAHDPSVPRLMLVRDESILSNLDNEVSVGDWV